MLNAARTPLCGMECNYCIELFNTAGLYSSAAHSTRYRDTGTRAFVGGPSKGEVVTASGCTSRQMFPGLLLAPGL